MGRDSIIKCSAQDKTQLSEDLNVTITKTQNLDLSSSKDTPKPETTFKYQHNFDVGRENARIATKEVPKLDPFVLAWNKHIESI